MKNSIVRKNRSRRFTLETLENRQLLSNVTVTVNTLSDDVSGPIAGQTTLRDAITQANSGATADLYIVNFSVDGTIALQNNLPNLAHNMVINGPGAANLTIPVWGSDSSGISGITVDAGDRVFIDGVTLSGTGLDNSTPVGINNYGNLELNQCTFTNVTTTSPIINQQGGSLTIVDTQVSNNTGTGIGAVTNYGWSMVYHDTFSNNTATPLHGYSTGGAITNIGTIFVTNSTFTGNSATNGGAIYNNGTFTQSGNTFSGNTPQNISQQFMNTIIVNSLADDPNGPASGQVTLRDAINQANASALIPTTINFSVNGSVEVLAFLPEITATNLTIAGPGTSLLSIRGDHYPLGLSYTGDIISVSSGASVSITGVSLSGFMNVAGDVINNHGTLTLGNDSFLDDHCGVTGGIVNDGNLTVSNCVFSNNAAISGEYGGAIQNNGTLLVKTSSFTGDTASMGGSINNEGTSTIDESSFTNNTTGSYGGAIYSNGALFVTNSTFTGNMAGNGGAIIVYGTATVENSVFDNNVAGGAGSAIYSDASLVSQNNTFSGNSSTDPAFSGNPLYVVYQQ